VITRYLRKSGYVLGFNTYLNKIFEIRGLGLVYYWMMPRNCEKGTIKSRACVPLINSSGIWESPLKYSAAWKVLAFQKHPPILFSSYLTMDSIATVIFFFVPSGPKTCLDPYFPRKPEWKRPGICSAAGHLLARENREVIHFSIKYTHAYVFTGIHTPVKHTYIRTNM
jgi:hypothetical protein